MEMCVGTFNVGGTMRGLLVIYFLYRCYLFSNIKAVGQLLNMANQEYFDGL